MGLQYYKQSQIYLGRVTFSPLIMSLVLSLRYISSGMILVNFATIALPSYPN